MSYIGLINERKVDEQVVEKQGFGASDVISRWRFAVPREYGDPRRAEARGFLGMKTRSRRNQGTVFAKDRGCNYVSLGLAALGVETRRDVARRPWEEKSDDGHLRRRPFMKSASASKYSYHAGVVKFD